MKKMPTYQNMEPDDVESEYPPDETPRQRVPTKGPGFNAPRAPVPVSQRGDGATAVAALMAAIHRAKQRMGFPGRTAMGPRLTDAPGLTARTRPTHMPDSVTGRGRKPK